MTVFLNSPGFGILITIVAYQLGLWIRKKTGSDLANPLLIAVIPIILLIALTPVTYEQYQIGGNTIHFMLSPLTVALGLMLYRQRLVIKKYLLSLIIGILSGVLTSFVAILVLGRVFQLPPELIASAIPKSITMPMALSLSEMLDATPAITVVMVVLTGVSGALLAPFMVKFFPFLNPIAVGIGIGTASHAVGTGKAIEIGEKEGALSSAAIGITGIITVIVVPFLYPLISLF